MPLDRELERTGVDFVRYADDTVIWSTDYGRVCDAANILREMSDRIGPRIHPSKSEGIRLLVEPEELEKAEFRATERLQFVGHSVGRSKVSMGQKTISRLRSHVQELLYDNLIRHLQAGTQRTSQVTSSTDRDYVTYVSQLRRYLYGDLTETQLRKYLRGGIPPRRFKGLMSFFPLVNDDLQLKRVDQWITNTTRLALEKRGRLLVAAGVTTLPPPHGMTTADLARHRHTSGAGAPIDLRLPSVTRASALIRAVSARYGPGAVRGGVDPYDY